MHLPAVTIDHKTFRLEIPALDLADGEILGIFGKSGAGKTSYMKRIRQLLDPRQVHYMSQFDGLLEEITVRQNVELGLAATGQLGKEAREWETRHAEILRDFEVDRQLSKYPRQLSGGQRKRAEIVRSLIMDPQMLLLDEPFNGIGHLFEAICTREILKRGEHSTGNTMIVSHDVDLLATFSNRIMLVDDHGVIGFVPTRDASWHPENVRTAWTLGVENVLSHAELALLQHTGLPSLSADQSLGFWARFAMWGAQGEKALSIPRTHIASSRSTMKQGMTYTRVEIEVPGHHQLIVLTGQGNIPEGQEAIVLGVRECWVLEN